MDDVTPALEELSRRLWDERRVVTYLLFKLTVIKLLLAADERRFLAEALQEVDRTVGLLRGQEEQRETALRELAGRWQVAPDELTLPALASLSPAPFDHTFTEHHQAFKGLAEEIEAVARENRTLARTDLQAVTSTLDQLAGTDGDRVTMYDAQGQVDAGVRARGRVREVL